MSALDALLLGLEPIGDDVFAPREAAHTLFGGMLMARALQAAGETVDGRPPHALEGRFLQGGAWDQPATIHVQRLRDGGLLSSRRAEIRQGEAVLFTLDASFGRPPETDEYQQPPPEMPSLEEPGIDEWRGFDDSMGFATREHLVGVARHVWAEPRSAVPDDPLLRAATLALLSDTRMAMTAMGSINRPTNQRASSLNHAMWFHRPVPPGWFHVMWTPVTTINRLALVLGAVHAPDGTRCATFVQELLLREQQPEFRPSWKSG